MVKLLLSDLDETLLVDQNVPQASLDAINAARKKGVKFVVATGRGYQMIPHILKQLGSYDCENEYTICYNGGMIFENKNHRVLHFVDIAYNKVKALLEISNHYDVCVTIFTKYMCYILKPGQGEVERKTIQNSPFEVVEGLDISFLEDEEIAKILFVHQDMNYLRQIHEEIKSEILKLDVCVSFSSNRYMEFNAQGVDKGTGLKWLANHLGIDIEDTMAVGDNLNDFEMIKAARIGVSVQNAVAKLKEVSQYITTKNHDDGAMVEVIHKFILEEVSSENI